MTTHKELLFKTAEGIFNHTEDFKFQKYETHISSGTTCLYVTEKENNVVIIELETKFTFEMLEKTKKIVRRAKEIYPPNTSFLIHVEWKYDCQTENKKIIKRRTENIFSEVLSEIFDESYIQSRIMGELTYWEANKRKYFALKKRKKGVKTIKIENSYGYINKHLTENGYEPQYMEQTGIAVQLFDMSIIFECGENSFVQVSVLKNLNSCVIAEREIIDLDNLGEEFNLYKMLKTIINPEEAQKKELEYSKTLNAILDTAFIKERPEYVMKKKVNEKTLSKSAYFVFEELRPKISTLQLTRFLGKLFDEEELFKINEISKKIRRKEVPFILENIEETTSNRLICHVSFEKANGKKETFQIYVSDFDVELYPKVL